MSIPSIFLPSESREPGPGLSGSTAAKDKEAALKPVVCRPKIHAAPKALLRLAVQCHSHSDQRQFADFDRLLTRHIVPGVWQI